MMVHFLWVSSKLQTGNMEAIEIGKTYNQIYQFGMSKILYMLSLHLCEIGPRRHRPILSATAMATAWESIGYPLLGPFLMSKEGT